MSTSTSTFTWRRIGAWSGGTAHSVALSSDVSSHFALAATDAGMFRSTDSGRTWARANGLAYIPARTVVFAPDADDGCIAFAATQDGSLFRSADAGATWQRQSSWAFGAINALALSPNFASAPTLFAATADGIYRSLDGGRIWQSASFGLLDGEVLCLACAPDFATSEVAWAGSATGGLYRSRNAGRAWRESGEGLADNAVQSIVYSSAMLFVGTEDDGVFRSSDGAHWEACGLDGMAVNCLAASAGHVLAGTSEGIFLSDDDGQTWQCVLSDDGVLAQAASASGSVVAGGMTTGVTTSADGGRTWQRAGDNAHLAAHVPPLAAQSPDGALFLFDVVGGAVCSIDGGTSWRSLRLDDSPIECVAAGGTARQTHVLVATAHSVLRWQGDGFMPLANQPTLGDEDAITAIAVTPDGALLLGTQQGLVAISADGGATWHVVAAPGAGAVNAVRQTPSGSLFVLRLASAGPIGEDVLNAEVWHLPALVLPMAQPSADWRMVLALDALRAPLACMTLAVSAEGECLVLASQNVVAVAALGDGQARTATLPDGTAITSLVAAQGHLFVGTNRGVFASADGGVTWQRAEGDLIDAPVVALFADGHGARAVTLGGEVWRCDVPE